MILNVDPQLPTIIQKRRLGEQILQNKTNMVIACLRGWKEPDCHTCAHGGNGDIYDTCDVTISLGSSINYM